MIQSNVELSIDILKKAPVPKFNMWAWAHFDHHHEDGEIVSLREPCGTSGCAAGWIASDKRANKLGLSLVVEDGEPIPLYQLNGVRRTYVAALMKFLEIEKATAYKIFIGGAYDYVPQDRLLLSNKYSSSSRILPNHVIDRLQLLLDLGGDEKRFNEMIDGP